MHLVPLEGCRSDVLAHYLKALGVFRLVATQIDHGARAFWRDGTFHLLSKLDEAALLAFFLQQYAPTPMVAPWNGGSGFYPKDNTSAADALSAGAASRFSAIREALTFGAAVVANRKVSPKDEDKLSLIASCRSTWPPHLLPWLDAAVSMTGDKVRYPALLGTGGNDGRLDFTNNFMQRLTELVDPATGAAAPGAAELLSASLRAAPASGLGRNVAIGQFLPGAAGGANATAGFDGDSLVNGWDFVLALEGAISFQVAATRRLEANELPQAAAPFAVRATGAGYASSSAADESARGEQWLPLWGAPATWAAFVRLLREARLLSGRATAANAIDAATAISHTGAARGIDAFQRFGFIERNGQANLAVPLGLWPVRARREAKLIDQIEPWVRTLRIAANAPGAPAKIGRQARAIQTAILELLRQPSRQRFERLLVRLSQAEDALVRSPRWAKDQNLRPLPWLEPELVDAELDFDEPEVELARCLAALEDRDEGTLRWNCLPLDRSGNAFESGADRLAAPADIVWMPDRIVDSACAILVRRVNTRGTGFPFVKARHWARPSSVARFIAGELDDARLARLTRALMAVRWSSTTPTSETGAFALPPLFVACRLAWSGTNPITGDYRADSAVPKLLARGQGRAAVQAAERRLVSIGLRPRFSCRGPAIDVSPGAARRLASALLFPLSSSVTRSLVRSLSLEPKTLDSPA